MPNVVEPEFAYKALDSEVEVPKNEVSEIPEAGSQ